MRWPWSAPRERNLIPISDPTLATLFSPGGFVNLDGIHVGEHAILGLSAMYRAVSVVSGTLATLPMGAIMETPDGIRKPVKSVFDDPDGPDGQTCFEWKETMFANLMIHGRAFALKIRNEAGAVVRLPIVHPVCVRTEEPTPDEYQNGPYPVGGLWFWITLRDGTQVRLDQTDVFYIPALSLDAICPYGLLHTARTSFATSITADKAAQKMFSQGALISGIVSPDDDVDDFDSKAIKRDLEQNMTGFENAGGIAVVNRRLKFSPWTMTAADAQFLQSRQFQIEEIARWSGVPPHLLMATEKTTSWGTGIEEQTRALGRTVLAPWATRMEQRGTRIVSSANPRTGGPWLRFDFAVLERPSPQDELNNQINEVNSGLLTLNEARKLRNRPPVPGGDVARGTTGGAPTPPAIEPGDPNALG